MPIIKSKVTENMLGTLSARVPGEEPQRTAEIAGLH